MVHRFCYGTINDPYLEKKERQTGKKTSRCINYSYDDETIITMHQLFFSTIFRSKSIGHCLKLIRILSVTNLN